MQHTKNDGYLIPNFEYDRNTRFSPDDVEVGTRLIRHSSDGVSFWRVYWIGPKWSDQVYMEEENLGVRRAYSFTYVCRAAMWEIMR